MEFAGLSKPLTQQALDEAGQIVGIPNAGMWSVIHVESSGAGYQADRRPKILFERHVFHRFTGAASILPIQISRIRRRADTALPAHTNMIGWERRWR